MATMDQKKELIEVLKFTPRTYKIELGAYGGEVYFGRVDRKIYDYFKEHKIDMDEYATAWGEEFDFVPNEMRPFPPGSPYECDNLVHASGPTLDSSNYVTVYDEHGNEAWQCELDADKLDDEKVEVDCWEESYIDQQPAGTVIFWGGQGEKGLCYGGEIQLKAPFDPAKLKINFTDADGWCIVNGVEYDGEEIENYDYSTTGKWGENKWIIVDSNEEIYEGVSREDVEPEESEPEDEVVTNTEYELTEWFDKDVKPTLKGEYEVALDAEWPLGGIIRANWTGRTWKDLDGNKVKMKSWRGLANDPNGE